MKLYEVQSLDELKKLGSHKDMAAMIKKHIGKEVKIKTRSWQNVYDAICDNRELLRAKLIGREKTQTKTETDKEAVINCEYFISKEAEIIFYINELNGESRLNKLGVNKRHFSDKKKATKWRNDLVKKIHPDICSHPRALEATRKLSSIYNEMVIDEK